MWLCGAFTLAANAIHTHSTINAVVTYVVAIMFLVSSVMQLFIASDQQHLDELKTELEEKFGMTPGILDESLGDLLIGIAKDQANGVHQEAEL